MRTSLTMGSLAVVVSLSVVACGQDSTSSGESSVTGGPSGRRSADETAEPTPPGQTDEPTDETTPTEDEPAPSKPAPTTSYPTALSVFSHFGTGEKAYHLLSSDLKTVSTSVSVAGPPQFVPSKPTQLPLVTGAPFVVTKPARGACTTPIRFTLNGAEVSVGFIASDTLPSTACSDFADKIVRQGIAGTVDTKYPNGTAVRLYFDLTP